VNTATSSTGPTLDARQFSTVTHAGTVSDPWPGTAIQSALMALPATGGTVTVADGVWKIDSFLQLNGVNNFNLVGQSLNAQLMFTGAGWMSFGSGISGVSNATISTLTINANTLTPASPQSAMEFNNAQNVSFNNNHILGHQNGSIPAVFFGGGSNNQILNNTITAPQGGSPLQLNALGGTPNSGFVVSQNTFDSSNLLLIGLNNTKVTNNYFSNPTLHNFISILIVGPFGGTSQNITIDGNTLEAIANNAVISAIPNDPGGTSNIDGFSITNNIIKAAKTLIAVQSYAGNLTDNSLIGSNKTNVTITGNQLSSFNGSTIDIRGGAGSVDKVLVQSNTLQNSVGMQNVIMGDAHTTNATLIGGPEDDILVAGTGQQTMTGGGGVDKFVFDQAGPTNATITDFLPGTDKIEFDGLQSSTTAALNGVNGNTVLNVGDDQITLAGVTPNQLSPNDFIPNDFITVFTPEPPPGPDPSPPPGPPSGPNPSPPAGTTADMILRHGADGTYEIYDIGNNSVLAGYQLGQVGTDWAFVTLGRFNGSDTTDMLLRNSAGAFEVYDISNNNITNAASLGTVGLDWQVAGFADFNRDGMTDMMLRNSNTGAFEIYNISNNMIINAAASGTVGLNWQVGGFGNFSSVPGETDMIMRNTSTGGLEVYFNNNQSLGAASMGTVGLDWQIIGFGNFSSIPGETDMIMRNTRTGGLEVYDINHNQITNAAFIGTVGLDWQFAGIAPIHAPGASDLVLRNVNTGAFEVYDIANNQVSGAAALGAVGLDWQTGGFAADPPSASLGSSDNSTSQLVQAMAGLAGGSGAAESLNPAVAGADTSQQTFLTTPHA
jgi:hypothetical protein